MWRWRLYPSRSHVDWDLSWLLIVAVVIIVVVFNDVAINDVGHEALAGGVVTPPARVGIRKGVRVRL
jgi:hypothetical protein